MNEKKKVLLGMSGGVDSSVSAILLQNQGYEVIGVTMRLWENPYEENTVEDAKKICDILGIKHHVLDFRQEFQEKVMDYFIKTYQMGMTPNPCVMCNRYLKFGKMYEVAKQMDITYLATGHYATCEFDERYNSYVLKKSHAGSKDQSYVLYTIPKEILPFVLFPLSSFSNKSEIREIAQNYHLPIASKPDSQEICFIPDNNHIRFLDKYVPVKEGNMITKDRKILGKHTGYTHYTIGQRKGLGISSPYPLYVNAISAKNNEIIVGKKEDVYKRECMITDIHFLLPNFIKEKMNVKAKIRYAAKEAEATLFPLEGNTANICFLEPQMAITPGQAIVFYLDDVVLGGGIIK